MINTSNILEKFKKYEHEESKNLKDMLDNLNKDIPPLEFISLKIRDGKMAKPVSLGGNIAKAERNLQNIKAKKRDIEQFWEKAEGDPDLADHLGEHETGAKMQDALAYFDFLGFQLEQKLESLKLVAKGQPYDPPYTFKNDPAKQHPGKITQPIPQTNEVGNTWTNPSAQGNPWNSGAVAAQTGFGQPKQESSQWGALQGNQPSQGPQ